MTQSFVYVYFETLLKDPILVLRRDSWAAMVKGELICGAFAEKVDRDGKIVSLIRPCVDCGLLTGNFCEADCFAEYWLGSKLEDWNDNQFTSQCSACEQRYKCCHFCLGKAWATPEPHRRVNGRVARRLFGHTTVCRRELEFWLESANPLNFDSTAYRYLLEHALCSPVERIIEAVNALVK